MLNKQVKVIQPRATYEIQNVTPIIKKKKVCAYVRVSTDNEEQKTSYDAQVDEYTKRIEQNPEWEMVGIYADEGISGTSTKHRKQFNLMMDAARSGQIDLILTKSISRFARNTVDCLNHIREMRTFNVEIFFEKENIYSSDPKVDFLLTIMSSIAQEEARNISENVNWNVQKRFREGVPIVNAQRFLGYTKDKKGGNLVVVPEEAAVVKQIYSLYINGMGTLDIARRMMADGIKTGSGSTQWRASSVQCILKNEKYTGDLLQQKTVTVDYLSHKRVKNKNIAPQFHMENSHEAIIDKETFYLAQRIREDRAKASMGSNKNLAKYMNRYPLSAMIICLECGRTLKRRYWNYGKPSQRVMQQCGGYIDGKANCKAKATYHELIEGATIDMLNQVFLKNTDIVPVIKKVIHSTIKVSRAETLVHDLEAQNEEHEQALSNLVDMRIKHQSISEEMFNSKYQELMLQIKENDLKIKEYEAEFVKAHSVQTRLDEIDSVLKKRGEPMTELDDSVLKSFVYKMISVSPEELVFCIAGEKEYSDEEFARRRAEFAAKRPIFEAVYENPKYKKTMKYRVVII